MRDIGLLTQHSMASLMWFFATMQYDPGAHVVAAVVGRMLERDELVCGWWVVVWVVMSVREWLCILVGFGGHAL